MKASTPRHTGSSVFAQYDRLRAEAVSNAEQRAADFSEEQNALKALDDEHAGLVRLAARVASLATSPLSIKRLKASIVEATTVAGLGSDAAAALSSRVQDAARQIDRVEAWCVPALYYAALSDLSGLASTWPQLSKWQNEVKQRLPTWLDALCTAARPTEVEALQRVMGMALLGRSHIERDYDAAVEAAKRARSARRKEFDSESARAQRAHVSEVARLERLQSAASHDVEARLKQRSRAEAHVERLRQRAVNEGVAAVPSGAGVGAVCGGIVACNSSSGFVASAMLGALLFGLGWGCLKYLLRSEGQEMDRAMANWRDATQAETTASLAHGKAKAAVARLSNPDLTAQSAGPTLTLQQAEDELRALEAHHDSFDIYAWVEGVLPDA